MTGKLVRDRIPELMRAEGREPVLRTLEPHERLAALTGKLLEEAGEVERDPNLGELADVLEVLQAICRELGHDWAAVLEAAERKRAARGGFEGGVVIERFD